MGISSVLLKNIYSSLQIRGFLSFWTAEVLLIMDLSIWHIYSICISLTLQNEMHGLILFFLLRAEETEDWLQENNKTGNFPINQSLITVYSRGWIGKAGLGLCGLNQTGRTLYTYQGSCDRIHSVFLVLFWLDMDLEKQKDGATDMHVWNCLEWGLVFIFIG